MNVIGLGIDLVDVVPFTEKNANLTFRERVFTQHEIVQADDRRRFAETYAGKFAVKEAVMKALGAGIQQGLWFSMIEVLSNQDGSPALTLVGKALERATLLGVTRWQVSISHTPNTAAAVVLAISD
jgi:holo-[acyl-carrier protein] synthase